MSPTPEPSPVPAPRGVPVARAVTAAAVAFLGAATVAIENGFREPVRPEFLFVLAQVVLPWAALVTAGDVRALAFTRDRWRGPVATAAESVIAAAAVLAVAGLGPVSDIAPSAVAVIAARSMSSAQKA